MCNDFKDFNPVLLDNFFEKKCVFATLCGREVILIPVDEPFAKDFFQLFDIEKGCDDCLTKARFIVMERPRVAGHTFQGYSFPSQVTFWLWCGQCSIGG